MLKATISLLLLAMPCITLNIPLPRARQTCLVITRGSYEFEYVVSGINEQEVRCLVQDNLNKTLVNETGKSEFEGEFEVQGDEATVCFASLDGQAKAVSFDFMRRDDPLRGLIGDKQKMQIHENLYGSYQELQKLYRDQHFFIERNYIHEILLRNTEIAVIFFMIMKLLVVAVAAVSQLYFVKKLFEHNYRPLPQDS